MVCRTCPWTWTGVPLLNQTARGITSIAAISAASLGSWLFSSAAICCGAPEDGGGMKNRVPGLMVRPAAAVAEAAVLAAALEIEPMVSAADAASAADAQRKTRREM
jgi:hypothetical protein